MNQSIFSFSAGDQKNIYYHQWLPEPSAEVRAVLQIVHGLAEHSGRYRRFAELLTAYGIAVYASDLRGHGKTAGRVDQLGYVERGSYWEKSLEDIMLFNSLIRKQWPGKPCFIFGHSGGSFLVRQLMTRADPPLSGAILSGTGGDPGILGRTGLMLAKGMALLRSRQAKSPALEQLSFGKYNAAFTPNRTDFDWLSRDEEEVDQYIADPYCGSVSSLGLWIDLVSGVIAINQLATFQQTPKDLPVLLVAGALDPVGENGKGVREVYNNYKQAGLKDLQIKLYSGARHEILNESNRSEVMNDLLKWLLVHM